MFTSILENTTATLSITDAIICMVASIILGLVVALTHTLTKKYSKNFITVLVLLPLLVQVVIMMVNGNLGTSVAILGAFGLIRFRSMPGTSRELLSVFFAMAIGLAIGMGHITFAIVFTLITSLTILILSKTSFGEEKKKQSLKILIPEDLDYTEVFDDIFKKYTLENNITKVKTTNLGSMYEITYDVIVKEKQEKELIDALRTRNGNLNITLNHQKLENGEL